MLVTPRVAGSGQDARVGAFLPCNPSFGLRKDKATLASGMNSGDTGGSSCLPRQISAAPLGTAPYPTRTSYGLALVREQVFSWPLQGSLVSFSLLTS